MAKKPDWYAQIAPKGELDLRGLLEALRQTRASAVAARDSAQAVIDDLVLLDAAVLKLLAEQAERRANAKGA